MDLVGRDRLEYWRVQRSFRLPLATADAAVSSAAATAAAAAISAAARVTAETVAPTAAAARTPAAAAPRAAVSAAPGLHVLRHVPPAGHGSRSAELGRRVRRWRAWLRVGRLSVRHRLPRLRSALRRDATTAPAASAAPAAVSAMPV